MLLRAKNIQKEYGVQEILKISDLQIDEGDRIALIGRNGVGKSTLMKALLGEIECDSGNISRNTEIAYISQDGVVEDDALVSGKYISRFGLKESPAMSGGEKTKMAIGAAFSKRASILFADEPTTNLDVKAIEELEQMLNNYHGAILLISHDRQLINNVCNTIWELEDGNIRTFSGNYDEWMVQKHREFDYQMDEYDKYRAEKKRLEKMASDIDSEGTSGKKKKRMSNSEAKMYKGFAASKQGQMKKRKASIQSRLNHLEEKEKPRELPHISMKVSDYNRIRSKTAARVSGYSFAYENHEVLSDLNLDILAGKKTFIIGNNGCGKTTLLNAIVHQKDGIHISSEAKIGYFSQNHDVLEWDKDVISNVVSTAVVPEHICRAVLNNLYLSKLDMTKKVNVLSGGERTKVAIAKLLVSGCNFLIMDEPTNHLDIYTMESLERLLKDFDGTLLIVTHDRKFVHNLADYVYTMENKTVSCTQTNVEY